MADELSRAGQVQPKLGIPAGDGIYEVMPNTPMDKEVKGRLRTMARNARRAGRKLYIAREGDHWGVASQSLEALAKIYRKDPHDGFYEVSPRWHENLSRNPDLFIRPVEAGS